MFETKRLQSQYKTTIDIDYGIISKLFDESEVETLSKFNLDFDKWDTEVDGQI
jgi:hypothetical protein